MGKVVQGKILPDRIADKIDFDAANGCWFWKAARDRAGYGVFTLNGKTYKAHRLMWQIYKGEIPAEMNLRTLCKNRDCVNPDHHKPATQQEICKEGATGNHLPYLPRRHRTHCKRGHPFDDENTYHDPRGARRCRTCQRMWSLKYYNKVKEAA